MDLAVTPSGLAGKTTVITHEDHDRVIRLAILLQPVHQIAQTLIHTLYQGSVSRLFSRYPPINIFLVETLVLINRDMDRIM